MGNIASYQEGYNDGYTQAREDTRERTKKRLMEFISEQKEEDPQHPYSRGYNMCLKDLEEFVEVL